MAFDIPTTHYTLWSTMNFNPQVVIDSKIAQCIQKLKQDPEMYGRFGSVQDGLDSAAILVTLLARYFYTIYAQKVLEKATLYKWHTDEMSFSTNTAALMQSMLDDTTLMTALLHASHVCDNDNVFEDYDVAKWVLENHALYCIEQVIESW